MPWKNRACGGDACAFDNLTLELSAKAFKDDSDETLRSVCATMASQWLPLRKRAKGVSIMLWLADGSEILEYAGRLDDSFEWACWMGTSNPEFISPGDKRDLSKSLSHHPVKYVDSPSPRTYGWVKRLTKALRETFGADARVGAIFDPGPEFAYSDFKTKRHTEIGQKLLGFNAHFVKVDSTLNADSKSFAAFPDGLPQGTPFGTFLGRQFKRYAEDLGFDYLWLSNGAGFGFETWRAQGALFDGKRFYPERAEGNRSGILSFWSL